MLGRLPYGPRRRLFAAGRRLRTPRGVAPWRAVPGRVAAAHRRVPASSSTIPARRESPSRLGRPAPAARRPLPQGAGGGAPAPSPKPSLLVQPRSARGRPARARASRRLLERANELRGSRPPRTPLHPLVPRLHSQDCARPDCPRCIRLLENRLPPPRPPRRPPGSWLATRKSWPLGCPGPRAPSPPPSLRALCVRAAKLLEEPPGSLLWDDQGTVRGPKALVLPGATPACCCSPASRWPGPDPPPPGFPSPRVRASGAGEERGHRDASSAVLPEGALTCFGFAKPV